MDLVTAIQVFFVYSLFTVTFLLPPSAMCCEAESEGEYNYDLSSKKGPLHWGDIRPEWYMCKNGTMQSPIRLQKNSATLVTNSALQTRYRPSNAIIRSSGHYIEISWRGNAGYILISGTRYMLEQCHWHSPSEHRINGKRYDLELHMVHRAGNARIAVIGYVYSKGRPNTFLQSIDDELKSIAENKDREISLGNVKPEDITGTTTTPSEYFRYNGSLTAPPCQENVIWTVFTKERTVTKSQVEMLRAAVKDKKYTNARPLQPTNRHPVQLYKPREMMIIKGQAKVVDKQSIAL